jgi:hypothetical protein
MSVLAGDFWERAKDSLHAAEHVLPVSADTAASTATFLREGRRVCPARGEAL